jgi:capsular polysaccharide biosynthesis protein
VKRRTLRQRLDARGSDGQPATNGGDPARHAAPVHATTGQTEPANSGKAAGPPQPDLSQFPPPYIAPAQPTAAPSSSPPDPPTEPGVVGPLEAMLRHKALTVLPAIVLIAAALGMAFARAPKYTAESRLNVGRVNVPAYTLEGVVIGNQTLAVSYARAIVAPDVIRPASRQAGISPATARSRLSATPVPQSTLIRIDAKGPSSSGAIALANSASSALIGYVTKLNRDSEPVAILSQYQAAQRALVRAQRRLAAAGNSGSARVQQAQLDLQTAQLKASSLDAAYRGSLANQPAPNLVQPLSPATTATSDFDSILQELLLIAAVAGIVLGIALALLRANRDLLRRPSG